MLKVATSAALGGAAFGLGVALGFEREEFLLLEAACLVMVRGYIFDDDDLTGLNGMEPDGQRPAMWGVVAQYVGAGLGLIMIGLDQGLVAYHVTHWCRASRSRSSPT